MTKRNKLIALVLLLAFAGWMMMTVMPSGTTTKKIGNVGGKETYEPKFRDEGDLQFVSAESGDTLKTIDIELANAPDEIAYGMMYRKSMDINTGMLFFMPTEEVQSFYMRNTYVSLDIIFINSRHEIVSIQKNAEPLNTTSLPSTGPANFVLEVKGGYCDQFGIAAGDKIQFQLAE